MTARCGRKARFCATFVLCSTTVVGEARHVKLPRTAVEVLSMRFILDWAIQILTREYELLDAVQELATRNAPDAPMPLIQGPRRAL